MIPAKGYAAFDAQAQLGPFNFERREPGPHDVQFDILYCGVCHSDLHQIKNEWGNSIYPMVPGHEIVGRVTAVGAHVKKFKTGDLVGVGCLVDSCRECENCADGQEQYCLNGSSGTYNSYEQDKKTITYGGYSNKIVVSEDFVLLVSDKLHLPAVAPLLCAGITTWSPLRHWKVGKGHKVGVLGLGGLGHMAVKFAVSFGAEVTMLSTSPSKKADAERQGAHHFLLTSDQEQVNAARGKFDFIIDTVSAEHDYGMYLGLLKTNGVHICVGAPPTPASVHAFALIAGRKSIAGSMIGGIQETQEMLDYCAEHNIVSDIELIEMPYIQNAYDRMLKGDVRYRFVIDMATL
ncbi:NAD(P)-dependent alcohol dehydrogenase [Chitinophaga sp. LS1]|uniref:NAD(P)-dependent alcohol dehydrogenase n=1 Tax=Chitinophaga sp. LS1 TaxID=3051176 RepID=UPI002AABC426|nr:NAD(P)-dependent alcohol dehydrogenase [Chitinophaga sp. LS1]WPV70369.1 NAD(P)-dependent alcohol dehydrogenase [Chitinophaga sp. LS1]